MEDESVIVINEELLRDHAFFALFDGHGGDQASLYAKENILRLIKESPKWKEYCLRKGENHALVTLRGEEEKEDEKDKVLLQEALVQAFGELEEEMYRNKDIILAAGCTATAAFITPKWIICANIGDSRTVLGKIKSSDDTYNVDACDGGDYGSINIDLSIDHKPNVPEEKARIERNGGFVSFDEGDCPRVNGALAFSRSLGDFTFHFLKCQEGKGASEQIISPVADVTPYKRDNAVDEILLLACDGLWDVCTSYEAVSRIKELWTVYREKSLELCAEECLDWALSRKTTDNVSVILVKLPAAKIPEEEEFDEGSKVGEDATERIQSIGGGVARIRAIREREPFDMYDLAVHLPKNSPAPGSAFDGIDYDNE